MLFRNMEVNAKIIMKELKVVVSGNKKWESASEVHGLF